MTEISLPIYSDERESLSSKTNQLHEASRRYDAFLIIHLLEKERLSPNSKDENGKTPLHVLLSDGFFGHLNEQKMLECLQILVEHNCDINARDGDDETAISLAVLNKFQPAALYLVQNGADTAIRTPTFKKAHSLATTIATTMPKVMMEMLDSGVTVDSSATSVATNSTSDNNNNSMIVRLDWRPLLQYPNSNDVESKKYVMMSGKRNRQLETSFLNSFLKAEPEARNEYLKHPLTAAFVSIRVLKSSRRLFLLQIILVLYPILYMIFIYFLYFDRCKFLRKDFPEEEEEEETFGKNATLPRADQTEQECQITPAIFSAALGLSAIVFGSGAVELYLVLFKTNLAYILSWRAMILRVAVVTMGFTLWPALNLDGVLREITWQYPFAALGTFFAWILFLIQMELIPKVKIYLEMLATIILSVIKIVAFFLPLFIGFYMGFKLLFFDLGGIVNFIMMAVDIGSNEYEDMKSSPKDAEGGWFTFSVDVFATAFIIIITIVFINFLLGTAISDIEELRRNAKIRARSQMVQNVCVFNLIFNSAFNVLSQGDIEKENWYCTFSPATIECKPFKKKLRRKIISLLKSKRWSAVPRLSEQETPNNL